MASPVALHLDHLIKTIMKEVLTAKDIRLSCAIVSTMMRTASAMTPGSTATTTPSSSTASDAAPNLTVGAGRRRRRAAARQRRKTALGGPSEQSDLETKDNETKSTPPEAQGAPPGVHPEEQSENTSESESVYDDLEDEMDAHEGDESNEGDESHEEDAPPEAELRGEEAPARAQPHLSEQVKRALANGWVPPAGLRLTLTNLDTA